MRDNGIPLKKRTIEILEHPEESEHFHQDIELLFVFEGELWVKVGAHTVHMCPEDVFIINANQRHRISGTADALFLKMTILWNMVSEVLQRLDIIFRCDSTREDGQKYVLLRSLLKKILNHYVGTHDGSSEFAHIALRYQLLDVLAVYFMVQPSDGSGIMDRDKYEDRIQTINSYIHANYNMPVSLNDLAERLNLSVSYLSRYFKKNYGMNFADYLKNIRVHYAVEMLLYSDTPITRIVYDSGFPSVSAFNKAFKEIHGETPSAMRKRCQARTDEKAPPVPSNNIKQRLSLLLEDNRMTDDRSEIPHESEMDKSRFVVETIHADKVFSAEDVSPTKTIWSELINIGMASDLLRSEVREHVVLLKNALNFKYVRFGNIFSKDMLLNLEESENGYNFSQLDSILDFLIGNGIKPHMDLGVKPRRIHRTRLDMYVKDYEGSEFPGWEVMEIFVHYLMRHLLQRYGREELDGWRMELWFDEYKWLAAGGKDNYLSGFEKIQRIIRSYSQDMKFGGCGLRADRTQASMEKFLRMWKDRKCLPDFLSVIYYDYEYLDDGKRMVKSSDNDHMLHRLSMIRRIMNDNGFSDVPMYLSEWNLTVSDRNFINDTCFKGAYIVKSMLDSYNMTDVAGYYTGSDMTSSYYDSADLLYGGTGLVSRDGILKPAGYAFDFLNRLYPYFVSRGSNYLMTANGKDAIGVICHNQKPLNYHYFLSSEDDVDRTQIWKYFDNHDELDLVFHLTGLLDGTYKLKVLRVNEQSGSILDIWKDIGFDNELSRNDIQYIQRICEPKMTIQKLHTDHGQLDVPLKLAANEIAYMQIRRLF